MAFDISKMGSTIKSGFTAEKDKNRFGVADGIVNQQVASAKAASAIDSTAKEHIPQHHEVITKSAVVENREPLVRPTSPIKPKSPTKTKVKVVERVEKVCRDNFSAPQADLDRMAALLDRTSALKARINKSELIRTGLLIMENMKEKELAEWFEQLDRQAPGRPKVYKEG